MTESDQSDCVSVKKVQVGCGPRNIRAGWLNTDLRPFPGIDRTLDVTEPWPWNNELEAVYGEHFLEHLSIDQASAFFINAGAALREGGLLRLSTPALEYVIETHFPLPPGAEEAACNATLGTNRAFHGWGHKFLYSQAFLSWTLAEHGFNDIEYCEYGVSRHSCMQGMEMHGGYRKTALGFPTVWIVEAVSGPGPILPSERWTALVHEQFLRHVASGH